jgi:signal transduction histidine kinase
VGDDALNGDAGVLRIISSNTIAMHDNAGISGAMRACAEHFDEHTGIPDMFVNNGMPKLLHPSCYTAAVTPLS